MFCVGIDCGIRGAITFLSSSALHVYDMPTKDAGMATRAKKTVDGEALAALFGAFDIMACYLEQPHSMPRDGAQAAFSFGENVGVVKGVLNAMRISYFPINPASWKAAMGLSSDKAESVSRALKLFAHFPHASTIFIKSKDGRAESALLASLAMRQHNAF